MASQTTNYCTAMYAVFIQAWPREAMYVVFSFKLCRVKPCMLFFIQTLPRVLCTGALSHVSFFDLFGPIAGVTNPIM